MSTSSPCLTCGACCAFFRVSFHWQELVSAGGTVPDELTLRVNHNLNCMAGTESNPVRCTALVGEVGRETHCTIYQNRSSTCREFDIYDADGQVSEACTRARAEFGLERLTTEV